MNEELLYHDFPTFVAHFTGLGKAIFFDPCEGNNGDDLIIKGAETVLKNAGARISPDPESADLIVINGGGMFVEGFKQGLRKVSHYSTMFPEKILCIGPQSFHLSSDSFRTILASRNVPTVLCVREQPSISNLEKQIAGLELVTVLHDHDLAFYIDPSDPGPSGPKGQRHILIVERTDSEHYTSNGAVRTGPPTPRDRLRKLIPDVFRRPFRAVKRSVNRRKMTPYRQYVEATISRDFPQFEKLPRYTDDLSDREAASFEQFVRTIADSAVIFSDRLHVGILGARMGKPTYLFEGNYHKCTGIFERSMSHLPNVKLIPRSAVVSVNPVSHG